MTEASNTNKLDPNLLRLTLVHPTDPAKNLDVENLVSDVGLRDDREMRIVGASMALALRKAVLDQDKRRRAARWRGGRPK